LLFVKAARRIRKAHIILLLLEPLQWFEAARYVAVALDTQPSWSAQVNQVKMKVAERLGVLGLFLNKRRGPT
jgi:hypothetical protein